MNQEQATKLVKLAEEIGWAYFDGQTRANKDHIARFADSGVYQIKHGGREYWTTLTNLRFDCSPEYYRPVPERKINWEKAMKNGAWGMRVLVWDSDEAEEAVARTLLGYFPGNSMPFVTRCMTQWANCKPLPGFEVPESWLED